MKNERVRVHILCRTGKYQHNGVVKTVLGWERLDQPINGYMDGEWGDNTGPRYRPGWYQHVPMDRPILQPEDANVEAVWLFWPEGTTTDTPEVEYITVEPYGHFPEEEYEEFIP
jgi:hypothetical protein